MRILACSDIHGNVDSVKKIRDCESNNFDAIVVAGDIGNGNAVDVISCFGGFGCPVLYVYGNWDNDLQYDVELLPEGRHLHANLVCIDGYYFGGYSGCSASWGMNPVYLDLLREVEFRYGDVVRARDELMADFDGRAGVIRADFLEKTKKIKSGRHKLTLAEYRKKLAALRRREELAVDRAKKDLTSYLDSGVYKGYVRDRIDRIRSVGLRNLVDFSKIVSNCGIDQRRLIMVTHDRIYRINDCNLNPMAYVFGHLHVHKVSRRGGTVFVNVAAVDVHESMMFHGRMDPDGLMGDDDLSEMEGNYKKRSCGYCVLEMRGSDVSVIRKEIV